MNTFFTRFFLGLIVRSFFTLENVLPVEFRKLKENKSVTFGI